MTFAMTSFLTFYETILNDSIRFHFKACQIYKYLYNTHMEMTPLKYVLHAFQKKTRKTTQQDIDLARQRYKQIGG